MLLDDEEIVLKGIQKVFDLQAFGFELVGAFSNPVKALDQVKYLHPDLLITDVKMPQMDGLEVSGKIKQSYPDTEIVILSGYDDFSYAQTAVKIGVSDYLLKPIKKDDFGQMLTRMHRKIDERCSEKKYYQALQEFAENNFSELKNRFFLDLAENEIFDEKVYSALQYRMGTEILESDFVLLKVELYQIDASEDYMSEVGKISSQIAEELAAYGNVEEFLSDESLYFYLYGISEEDREDVSISAHALLDAMGRQGMRFSLGVSQLYSGIRNLFAARNDCTRQILMSAANIDEASEENPVRRQEMNVNIPYAEIENLFRAVSVNDADKIEAAVEKIYEIPVSKIHMLYRDYSVSITFLILLRMYQLQNKYGEAHIIPQELLDIKKLRRAYSSVEQQKCLVKTSAECLMALIGQQEVAAPSKTILSALEYINAHFSENISLTDVAEAINISKNYLCDIFKKELGVTFINYVTNLRIEKAKEYLSNTDMKMYEVSDAVGYSDYAYFSQIFKKHTGITLSAYRRQN